MLRCRCGLSSGIAKSRKKRKTNKVKPRTRFRLLVVTWQHSKVPFGRHGDSAHNAIHCNLDRALNKKIFEIRNQTKSKTNRFTNHKSKSSNQNQIYISKSSSIDFIITCNNSRHSASSRSSSDAMTYFVDGVINNCTALIEYEYIHRIIRIDRMNCYWIVIVEFEFDCYRAMRQSQTISLWTRCWNSL